MEAFRSVISGLLSAVIMFLSTAFPGLAPKNFDVTIDEKSKEFCDIIKENSYIDIEELVTGLPDLNAPARVLNKVFFFDNGEFSSFMYRLRDRCYEDDRIILGKLFYLIGAYFEVFESASVCLEEQEDGKYQFIVYVNYANGKTGTLTTGAFYDPDTGLFYGKNDKGMFDIGYNFDMNEMLVYATVNCWMRDFGFCLGYDIFTYITPLYYYETRRFKFNYGGKEWMIQAWKGMYVAANGAEVGVYNRDPIRFGTFYDCAGDEDMLNMSFELYHDDELLFSRPECLHWWINGFQLSKELYDADELTLKFTIEMKDEQMLKAFTRSVDFNIHRDVTYKVEGLKVYLEW